MISKMAQSIRRALTQAFAYAKSGAQQRRKTRGVLLSEETVHELRGMWEKGIQSGPSAALDMTPTKTRARARLASKRGSN